MAVDRKDRIKQLFQCIDNKDVDGFMIFLDDDVLFRFGNAEPVKGKIALREVLTGFFGSINNLRHKLERTWDEKEAIICHGNVTYTRHDMSTLSVPFSNIFSLRDELIAEYLIFVDTSDLYEPA